MKALLLRWKRYAWTEEKVRSEEHTSELQSRQYLVCRLLLEKQKTEKARIPTSTSCAATRRKTSSIAFLVHQTIGRKPIVSGTRSILSTRKGTQSRAIIAMRK